MLIFEANRGFLGPFPSWTIHRRGANPTASSLLDKMMTRVESANAKKKVGGTNPDPRGRRSSRRRCGTHSGFEVVVVDVEVAREVGVEVEVEVVE